MKKIDVFNHILPEKYYQALVDTIGRELMQGSCKILRDVDMRIDEMSEHDGLEQVLTLVAPEELNGLSPKDGTYLSALANDCIAEIVQEHPRQFPAGIGTVYMDDPKETEKEIRRLVEDLDMRGIQISTTIAGKDLTEKEYLPVFEQMAHYDLPIFIHPCWGPNSKPDGIFDWPLETSWMMIKLAASDVFERLPNLKLVTHHLGAMIPTFSNRIYSSYYINAQNGYLDLGQGAAPISADNCIRHLKMFYNDTALYGDCTAAIQSGLDFFGVDRVLFGTDYPLDGNRDPMSKGQTKNTIDSICNLKITTADREKIFWRNAKKLMKL